MSWVSEHKCVSAPNVLKCEICVEAAREACVRFLCETEKFRENSSLMRVIWVILSTVAVTFKNNNSSNLTEESHKEQLGSITVWCVSHRKACCLFLSGLWKNWQSFRMPHFSAHIQIETQKKNKLSLSSVCRRSQLLIMKTCMVLHKENDLF